MEVGHGLRSLLLLRITRIASVIVALRLKAEVLTLLNSQLVMIAIVNLLLGMFNVVVLLLKASLLILDASFILLMMASSYELLSASRVTSKVF